MMNADITVGDTPEPVVVVDDDMRAALFKMTRLFINRCKQRVGSGDFAGSDYI